MAKVKKAYDQRFRFSFSPSAAVVMAAPSKSYNRQLNLQSKSSSQGLVQMHGGRISANSSRKIRNAIDWLLASAEEKYLYSKKNNRFYTWKLSFLTLTLPTQGNMTDTQVKSILNSFLTLAKYNYGLHSYIWKAEPQSRGVIHFHLTSDCYMWKNSVRFEWNRLLSKHGLNNGHSDAPSTKIHSTYRVKNMAAYLTKYFIKPPAKFTSPPFKAKYGGLAISYKGDPDKVSINWQNIFYVRPISGRLWGCSHSLSEARSLSYTVDTSEMRAMNSELRQAKTKEVQKTYCNFHHLPADYYDKLSYGQLKHDYNVHRLKIRKVKDFHQFELYGPDGEIITDQKILRKFEKHKSKKNEKQN